MSGQITTNGSVLQILVKRLHAPVDASTRQRATHHLIDWLGTAMLGRQHPAAKGFFDDTASLESGVSTTLSGHRRDWWAALQLNAALGNLLEMDDLHRTSILHPGPVIVPAAIAVAEMVGASGAALLDAIVRGYEATIRIGAALGKTHYRYFHNTSTCGTFGAAAAAASLLGLNAQQTVWALANAGSRTGGLWQMRHEACETKSLHNVVAAQTGVQAALLAARGVRGPARLLEGEHGLFAAFTAGADPSAVIDDIDRDWQIHDVSFKPWPACRHAHPVIDAALQLYPQLTDAEIESVVIETYQSAIDFCNKPQPQTELEAKFSLQHCAAVVLHQGAPGLGDFSLARIQDAAIANLRSKVSVIENAQMSGVFPNHYQASMQIVLHDGRVLNHLQADAKGDPELPLAPDEICAKAAALLNAAGVKDEDAAQLIAATLAIGEEARVTNWTARWPT